MAIKDSVAFLSIWLLMKFYLRHVMTLIGFAEATTIAHPKCKFAGVKTPWGFLLNKKKIESAEILCLDNQ